jgi:hypothetical protein
MALCIYQFICCQRNEQQIKLNMMLAALGSRLLIVFFVMPPMRECIKRTIPLQYQVTHHIGSFQMDAQLGTHEKANTWLN